MARKKTVKDVRAKMKMAEDELVKLRASLTSKKNAESQYPKEVVEASRILDELHSIPIENPSLLVRYRQNITVPVQWIPVQGVRAENIGQIPPENIVDLDRYITASVKNIDGGELGVSEGTTIQLRRALSSTWHTLNPVLKPGELGLENDTRKVKIGNGVTPWRDLEYGIDQAGNISISGNTISSTNPNGDITLDPNGSGGVFVNSDLVVSGDVYSQTDKKLATEDYVSSAISNNSVTVAGGLQKQGNEIRVGTADESRIVVNEDSIDLALTGVIPAVYDKITVDAYGRVVSGELNFVGAITSVGVLTSGVWQATVIDSLYGGTGVASNSSKISIRSQLVNFKQLSNYQIFTVPTGFAFLIDSMEVITTSIISPFAAPHVRFGNSSNSEAYYSSRQTVSNSPGARHIVENPQNAIFAGSSLTFGVTVASGALEHTGYALVSGLFVKIN